MSASSPAISTSMLLSNVIALFVYGMSPLPMLPVKVILHSRRNLMCSSMCDPMFGSAVKVMLAPVFFDINRLRFVVLGEPQSPSSASLVVALR